MCYGLDQECGYNIHKRSIIESTIVTIFTKVVDEVT